MYSHQRSFRKTEKKSTSLTKTPRIPKGYGAFLRTALDKSVFFGYDRSIS